MNIPIHYAYPYNTSIHGYQDVPPAPRVMYHLPRVVLNQKSKFKTDETFKALSIKSEIRYTGRNDLNIDQRRKCFLSDCVNGHVDISFISKGITIGLAVSLQSIDVNNPPEKIYLNSSFIMNAVCVRFQGWIDVNILDGIGYLEYDEEKGEYEDAILKEKIKRCHQTTSHNSDEKSKYCISQEMPRQEEYWENRNVC
ncbi:protein big brother-like [Onthophagus taurus]|uniref:protein big brother-like n=1 Tax=Onthophagus taurus TaxID=166361 RepID=UPI000C20A058|nr:protein big brother-like [Onthophagus taurus]